LEIVASNESRENNILLYEMKSSDVRLGYLPGISQSVRQNSGMAASCSDCGRPVAFFMNNDIKCQLMLKDHHGRKSGTFCGYRLTRRRYLSGYSLVWAVCQLWRLGCALDECITKAEPQDGSAGNLFWLKRSAFTE
jgi:hypothetical protein